MLRHIVTWTYVWMKAHYGNHGMALRRSEPIVKISPNQAWIQYHSHDLHTNWDIGMGTKLFIGNIGIYAQIVIESFSKNSSCTVCRNVLWCALYVTLLVLWTLARPTIHAVSKHARPSLRPSPYTYFRHILYLIDISWSSDVLQRFREIILLLCDLCLVPHTKLVSPN